MRLPGILRIRAPHVVTEVGVLLAVANGTGLRVSEQEIGEVVAGTGHGDAVLKLAGDFAGKVERATAVRIAVGRQIIPAEKLFDTVSAPPMESIPRAPLPLAAESAPVDPLAPEAAPLTADAPPATPEVPSHNA